MPYHEQMRLVNWRLKILREAALVPRSMSAVCLRYGISRKTFYKWKKRFEAEAHYKSNKSNKSEEKTAIIVFPPLLAR